MVDANISKVLVTDGRTLSCLAIARELGRQGFEVHVGESFEQNLSAYSKFSSFSHTYPSADTEPDEFRAEILDLIHQIEFDFVIPIRDSTTMILAEIQNELPSSTHVLLDTADKIESLNDKAWSSKLAEDVGVPIPNTYYPSEMPISEISQVTDYPVLVKPTDGSGARGIRRVENAENLESVYHDVTRDGNAAVIQEYIDHSGGHYSIGTVFDRQSNPKAIHVYKELLQYPDSGGPAIRAKSVSVDPWVTDLLEVLRAVDWIGPAHMDVLFDPTDNTFKLLEINPRIWMSVNLSIKSGVDIPQVILENARGNDFSCDQRYNTDLLYRWVLPNEILWALSAQNRLQRIYEYSSGRKSPVCYGVMSRDDPLAIGGFAAQSIQFLFDSEKRQMIFNRGW